jgi:hypothetical protein
LYFNFCPPPWFQKAFPALLGAAPSLALAGLIWTMAKNEVRYAAVEARSLILGVLHSPVARSVFTMNNEPPHFWHVRSEQNLL